MKSRQSVLLESRRLAWVLMTSSCGQIVGIDDYQVNGTAKEGGSAHIRGFEFENRASGECMADFCGPALDACSGEPACAGFVACDAACALEDLECASSLHGALWSGAPGARTLGCACVSRVAPRTARIAAACRATGPASVTSGATNV